MSSIRLWDGNYIFFLKISKFKFSLIKCLKSVQYLQLSYYKTNFSLKIFLDELYVLFSFYDVNLFLYKNKFNTDFSRKKFIKTKKEYFLILWVFIFSRFKLNLKASIYRNIFFFLKCFKYPLIFYKPHFYSDSVLCKWSMSLNYLKWIFEIIFYYFKLKKKIFFILKIDKTIWKKIFTSCNFKNSKWKILSWSYLIIKNYSKEKFQNNQINKKKRKKGQLKMCKYIIILCVKIQSKLIKKILYFIFKNMQTWRCWTRLQLNLNNSIDIIYNLQSLYHNNLQINKNNLFQLHKIKKMMFYNLLQCRYIIVFFFIFFIKNHIKKNKLKFIIFFLLKIRFLKFISIHLQHSTFFIIKFLFCPFFIFLKNELHKMGVFFWGFINFSLFFQYIKKKKQLFFKNRKSQDIFEMFVFFLFKKTYLNKTKKIFQKHIYLSTKLAKKNYIYLTDKLYLFILFS